MFRLIQVPLDGSPFAEHALPLAVSLAKRESVTLQIVHVHESTSGVYLHPSGRFVAFLDQEAMDNARERLEATVTSLAEKTDFRPEWVQLKGPIPETIAQHASASEADLLIMTTHGRGPLARLWFGSVADSLVRQSPIPVLLIRPQEEAPNFVPLPTVRHVLIPLDGSELAEQAIDPALSLANAEKSEFTLLRVVPEVMTTIYDPTSGRMSGLNTAWLEQLQELKRQQETEARDYLERLAERLRARSVKVYTLVVAHDQPATAILDAASRRVADAIALTTRGRGGLKRLFLGSVADKVIRGATTPILICPPIADPVDIE